MAFSANSRVRQAAKLAVVVLIVGPLLVQWGAFGGDLVAAVGITPNIDAEGLVRLVGLGLAAGVLVALVLQKRRARGQQASASAPEQASDRQVEGSGDVYAPYAYNNQQRAHREGERIRERAEKIANADRETRKRR